MVNHKYVHYLKHAYNIRTQEAFLRCGRTYTIISNRKNAGAIILISYHIVFARSEVTSENEEQIKWVSSPHHKNSTWIKDLCIKPKSINLSNQYRNIAVNFGVKEDFLHKKYKIQRKDLWIWIYWNYKVLLRTWKDNLQNKKIFAIYKTYKGISIQNIYVFKLINIYKRL